MRVTSFCAHADALLDAGLRIMIYSGDVDGIVPTTGTRMWVEGLGLPVRVPWTPWLSPGPGQLPPQVGGYVTEYDGLMFATVRGAGHMVRIALSDGAPTHTHDRNEVLLLSDC